MRIVDLFLSSVMGFALQNTHTQAQHLFALIAAETFGNSDPSTERN